MGFGGSALAMAQTLKNNAKQIAKRDNYFKRDVASNYKKSPKIVDYKNMSPAQFSAFQQRLKENEIRRQKNLGIVFGSVMLLIIGVLIYFLFFN